MCTSKCYGTGATIVNTLSYKQNLVELSWISYVCIFKKIKGNSQGKAFPPFPFTRKNKEKKQSLETNYDIKHARFII